MPHPRVQAVGADDVRRRLAVDEHVVVVRDQVVDRLPVDGDAGPLDRGQHRAVEDGAAHAQPGTAPEAGLRPPVPVDVADAFDGVAVELDAQSRERLHGAGHQSLAAGLVDHAGPALAHLDRQSGPGGVEGARQAGRAAAHHHQVTHGRAPPARRARRSRCGAGR